MTGILGSDDPPGRPARTERPVSLPAELGADVPVELLGDDDGDEPSLTTHHRWRLLLGALGEPASRAVAAVLFLLAGLLAGPSDRFDTYPFNQGITSLQNSLTASTVRPLHDFLTAAAPSIVLAIACVVAAALAVLRGRVDDPGWVRPVAAGALMAGILVLVLFGVGAYRTSTYDLTQLNASQTLVGSS